MILILQPDFIDDLYIEKDHVTFVYEICQDKEDSNKNKVRRERGLRGHVSFSFKSLKLRSESEQTAETKKNLQGPAQKTLILDQEYWPRLYPLKREKLKIYSSHF